MACSPAAPAKSAKSAAANASIDAGHHADSAARSKSVSPSEATTGGAHSVEKSPASGVRAANALPRPNASHAIHFETLGQAAGLDFLRDDDIHGQRRIFESTGGGVGIIDIDSDGWLDLLFTGGCKLPLPDGFAEPTCGLYKNLNGRTFERVTKPARLTQSGYCQGITVGDYDNDGFDDLYITAFGANGLWHNCGDGTFENVTDTAGAACSSWSTSCAFADLDNDGNLDLYVVNYLKESAESPLRCPNSRSPDGYEQCPPSKFDALDDLLLVNDGQGHFLDQTVASGIAGLGGKGLGIVVSDLDRNGWPDIYVGNDGEANFVLRNNSRAGQPLSFRECGLTVGAALTESGFAQASMGLAIGDYDHSGTMDIVVTNFAGDSDTFYQNLGNMAFEDVTRRSGLAGPSRPMLGWGTAMADFDGDNWLDLVVVNGHVDDRRWNGQGERYKMPPQLYRNGGRGRLEDKSRGAGDYFQRDWMARGLAAGDLDRDGRIDLAISHQFDNSVVLLNATEQSSPVKTLQLIGTISNRNGLGAQLEMLDKNGELVAYHELVGGSSFQSSNALKFHLAAGETLPVTVRIRWPSGHVSEHKWTTIGTEVLVENGHLGGH